MMADPGKPEIQRLLLQNSGAQSPLNICLFMLGLIACLSANKRHLCLARQANLHDFHSGRTSQISKLDAHATRPQQEKQSMIDELHLGVARVPE